MTLIAAVTDDLARRASQHNYQSARGLVGGAGVARQSSQAGQRAREAAGGARRGRPGGAELAGGARGLTFYSHFYAGPVGSKIKGTPCAELWESLS